MKHKERVFQVMDRKRLMVGDIFGFIGCPVWDQLFEVTEEYQAIGLAMVTDAERGTSIRGALSGSKMLRLYGHNGAWYCWLDMETGECYSDMTRARKFGVPIPIKIALDISNT